MRGRGPTDACALRGRFAPPVERPLHQYRRSKGSATGLELRRAPPERLVPAPAADPIATPLWAPRPGICGNARQASNELPLRPVAWSNAGLSVFVGGSELWPKRHGDSLPLGSARSANAEHGVVATELGVLVLHSASKDGRDSAELWRSENSAATTLSECVIDDTGTQVACIEGGRARVIESQPATPP